MDPTTIAAILAVLIPMLIKCFEEGMTDIEAKGALKKPKLRQRIVLMLALRRSERKALRVWWKQAENEDSTAMDDELAEEIVVEARAEQVLQNAA